MKKIITFLLLLLLTINKINAQEEKKVIGIAPFTGAYNESILNSIEEVVSSSFGKTKRFGKWSTFLTVCKYSFFN